MRELPWSLVPTAAKARADEEAARAKRAKDAETARKQREVQAEQDMLYESLLKSPTPPLPRCDRHAKLAETPVGCSWCAVAKRAWMAVAQRVAEERFEESKKHATEEATRMREAWWDDVWAAGDPQRAAQLAQMRDAEARGRVPSAA